jgi:hypothetical protein
MDSLNGAVKSKTVWLNIVGLLIMLLNNPGIVGLWIPQEVITSVLAILNLILRFLTSQSLAEKGAEQKA